MTAVGRPWVIAAYLAMTAFLLCCLPVPVQAHEGVVPGAAAPSAAAPEPPAVPWAGFLVGAAVAALGARRPRRSVALGLVLLLAVFAFESGVHSVHHLTDRGRLGECTAALASQQVAGTLVEAVVADLPPDPAGVDVVPTDPSIRAARPLGPHEGRAPPLAA